MSSRPKYLPPETLSENDVDRLNAVRRDLWTGGFRGLAYGLAAGGGGFLAARALVAPGAQGKALGPAAKVLHGGNKYLVLSALSLGALGSFAGAVAAGKNSVGYIGDIFSRGAKPRPQTEYQELMEDARAWAHGQGGGGYADRAAVAGGVSGVSLEQAMAESHARRMRAQEEYRQRRRDETRQ